MSSIPTISILVPIYNVEKYLPQCLDSLVNQTLKDIEIICLNDGSTDSSLDIIKSYAENDPRIVIIDKPNSGYGDSMNQGLKKAKGKYIGIVESDDWIELDAFAKLCQLADWYQADVVKSNYYRFKDGKNTKFNEITPNLTGKVFGPDWSEEQAPGKRHRPDKTDLFVETKSYRRFFHFAPAIWSAIYRREFLLQNDIQFLPTPGASYQDLSFSFKVWTKAKRVVLTADAFIHYRLDNLNSSVNNPGKVNCVVEEYAEIERFLRAEDLYPVLASTMWAAKFANYHWNLQRLSSKLAKEFYQTFRQEFTGAQQAGLLKRRDFSARHWLALQFILRHPEFAYRVLRFRQHML